MFSFSAQKQLQSLVKFIFNNRYKSEYINEYTFHSKDTYFNHYLNERIYLWHLLTNNNKLCLSEEYPYFIIGDKYYSKVIYNIDILSDTFDRNKTNFAQMKDVYANYINNGGIEILEIKEMNKKPDFNKLLDKDYVLGKK